MGKYKNDHVNENLVHLKQKKLFLFDIDGTIALSEDVLDGTMGLLAYIKKIGGRAIYITNNSSKSTADYVKKFERMGIEARDADFVTAIHSKKDMMISRRYLVFLKKL